MLPELQNPIFPAFAEVVAGALAKRGFTPVLCTRTADGVSEADYVDILLDQHVSGIIFAGGLYRQADADHEHYHRLHDRGLPACWSTPRSTTSASRGSRSTTAHAVDQAYGHLVSLGHERDRADPRPGGPRAVQPQAGRRSRSAARSAARPTTRIVERASSRWRAAGPAATRLIKRGVTGIICACDVLALGAIRAARRLGLRVPDDVSVVGFDDSPFMNCTDPPLTTVRQPIQAMGQAAVPCWSARSPAARCRPRRCSSSPSWSCGAPRAP